MLHFIGTVTIVGSTLTGEQPENTIIASLQVSHSELGDVIAYLITVQMYQYIGKVFIRVSNQLPEQQIGQLACV
jgi:hypothetical protein